MKEIDAIANKYKELHKDVFEEYEDLNVYAINFSKDLLELADLLSRVINPEYKPNFYTLNDATVVGLIIKIIKLYREAIRSYEENKLEIFAVFIRPLYESFITAKYLIKNGEESQINFRLISYKARFYNYKTIQNLDQNSPIIQRQLLKLKKKLTVDGFTLDDLDAENKKIKDGI